MGAHSPGPWRWSEVPVAGEVAWLERDRLTDANGATILCASGDEETEEGDGERFEGWVSVLRQDASVIAAAPTMLEMLRGMASADICPSCFAPSFQGHVTGEVDDERPCELAALLNQIDL